MVKAIQPSALALLLLLSGGAAARTPSPPAAPAAITGQWLTEDGSAVVTIAPCAPRSPQLCGRLTRFTAPADANTRDVHNPDRALRSRLVVGINILSGLTASGNSWTGRGYSPRDGRPFTATVSTDAGRLSVRGCVSIFCQTLLWTRAR